MAKKSKSSAGSGSIERLYCRLEPWRRQVREVERAGRAVRRRGYGFVSHARVPKVLGSLH